jgi:hypothetical protein
LGHVAASFKRKLATEQLKPAAETGSQGKKCLKKWLSESI